ncbi:MAG: tyrosine-protein phosphatase [Clostridiales bacterium]|nr:tyrosine-protein phosphatase [Candidatus Blautia equi]
MKYGKIRIDNGNFIYTRHMRLNVLPCTDILWAYLRKSVPEDHGLTQLPVNNLVIVTRRHKSYQFDMTEREVKECIRLLRALNPEMAVGFPKGGRINQKSLPNTRDLGALMSEDGRHIIPRKLLRSGHLYHCSVMDKEVLQESYHLSTVIDLRTHAERKHMPDEFIDGAKYHHVNLLDEPVPGVTLEQNIMDFLMTYHGDPEMMMYNVYRKMIQDPFTQKQMARFIDLLIRHGDGAVLYHDTFGTDRVGICTALVLSALDIPRNVIYEDYMKTNSYLEKEEEALIRQLESRTVVDNRVLSNVKSMFEIKEIYLQSAFTEIEKEYGSVERYLKKALFLTPKSLEQLKEKYLI